VADAPDQLTLDNLTAASALVPSGIWATLEHQEQLFVAAYLLHLNQARAARLAGFSKTRAKVTGSEMMAKPRVRAAVEAAMAQRSKRAEIEAEDVLRRWWKIATANPNDIVSYRRACCRHCHGIEFGAQRTAGEMKRDRAKWEAAQTKKSTEVFDEAGGVGYDRRKAPHPDCPECFGEGVGAVFIVDTRLLAGDALLLYAGVKETKDGLEVKLHDQAAALTNTARHLGMFAEKAEAPEDADARAARIRDALGEMDGTTLADAPAGEPTEAAA